ncbi:MAG: hypothetical protein JSW40_04230, partial [Candidatus Omnitrophota bacterium]
NRKKIKKILISLGGVDEFNFTLRIARLLERIHNKVTLTAVVGAGYRFKRELERFLKQSTFSSYRVQQNIQSMLREYMKADFVITSGGLSLFEVVALRLPAAAITLYPHQIKRAQFFEQKGYIVHLGFRKVKREKLARALCGSSVRFHRGRFLIDTLPEMVYERYRCKR